MMKTARGPRAQLWKEYGIALASFAVISIFGEWLQRWTGYQAISLVYLLSVVLLALLVGRGPILFGTLLTALGWCYLFAPPQYSFRVSGFYDKEMIAVYFLVALIVSQLTAVLRTQREVELTARLLKESERLGRTLLNSVSHELRTPLSTISGATHTLRSSGPLTRVQEKVTDEIETASARLNRVVQSLLSAARIQSGQLQPKRDWCDVKDVVGVAIRDAGPVLALHPIENRVGQGLPLIKADFVLLEQALSNILLNAGLHTPPGSPVTITAQYADNKLRLEIADRGPGLAPEQLERVFEPFHRAPNARPGGTGLGLHIVKGFLEAQGGHVRAANREGGGAVFTIVLPAPEFTLHVQEAA
jgi:two-component system sensor histidine kinase KdpD